MIDTKMKEMKKIKSTEEILKNFILKLNVAV